MVPAFGVKAAGVFCSTDKMLLREIHPVLRSARAHHQSHKDRDEADRCCVTLGM